MNSVSNYFGSIFTNWGVALKKKSFMVKVLFTFLSYFILFKYCRVVMAIFELRKGTQLNDILLNHLPVYDFSTLTFSLTYFALFLFVVTNISYPKRFIKGMQAYTLLLLMRTITIYLVPLEPPANMIVLIDPVSNFFMNSKGGGYIVKDLFFSGHISAIALFYFVAENKIVKRILLSMAIVIASLILLQHVHYTIDIIAAPFFSFLALKLVMIANKESSLNLAWNKKT